MYFERSLFPVWYSCAAHEGNVLERNHQFEHICQSVFTKSHGLCPSCKDLQSIMSVKPKYKVRHVHNFVEESDVVIWLGDLNYRVEMPRSSVGFLISHNLEEVVSQTLLPELSWRWYCKLRRFSLDCIRKETIPMYHIPNGHKIWDFYKKTTKVQNFRELKYVNHVVQILWPKDQLHIAVERGEVFRGFSEGPLLFHPTYKFEVGTDNYSKVSLSFIPSSFCWILYVMLCSFFLMNYFGRIELACRIM